MIERMVKQLGRRVGIDISHYRPFGARRMRQLVESKIATVIDVGANVGGYGSELRQFGYLGRIVSIEPVTAAFAELERSAAADNAWDCHNVAAGGSDGEATINVASNFSSSSLLAMSDEHRRGAPDVSNVGHEGVSLRRLDSLSLDIERPSMLKIDVQGYESQVLAGATNTAAGATLVECELSIARLYEGQTSFHEMIGLLSGMGFHIIDVDPFFYDREDGRVLAMDALFARSQGKTK